MSAFDAIVGTKLLRQEQTPALWTPEVDVSPVAAAIVALGAGLLLIFPAVGYGQHECAGSCQQAGQGPQCTGGLFHVFQRLCAEDHVELLVYLKQALRLEDGCWA